MGIPIVSRILLTFASFLLVPLVFIGITFERRRKTARDRVADESLS